MDLTLKQLWVISEAGLHLFSMENRQNEIGMYDRRIKHERSYQVDDLLKTSAFYNILSYFNECIIGEQVNYFMANNYLWVIHHKKSLGYAVVACAQIDLSKSIILYLNQLQNFCKMVSKEFFAASGYNKNSCKNGKKQFTEFEPKCRTLFECFESNVVGMTNKIPL